ncbi:hypothetical protein [Mesorhizobium kowhaii]|uniref:hypothetical protein n=1 Tax=Mesorhizobium kowhaii TaxID=1300272 RepID=UPI0011B46B65|nr:hypothetical protein [Mesorhizobium kowhaii]
MTNTILSYLGKPVSLLLTSPPFKSWKFKKTVDDDLPEIRINYVSARNKFSIICDDDEKIDTIFIESGNLDRDLFSIPFLWSRDDVLSNLGAPSKSGEARRDPILGEYGPWDRFDEAHHSIHVSYQAHADRIRMVTLMRADVVP